jgi:hypothetical protein
MQVNRKPDFFLKKVYIQWVLRADKNPDEQNGPLPGQESIGLAKKDGDSSFPDAGFRRFSPPIPLPPRFFAETKRGEPGRFLPTFFASGACFLARATRRPV